MDMQERLSRRFRAHALAIKDSESSPRRACVLWREQRSPTLAYARKWGITSRPMSSMVCMTFSWGIS
jgi:hypothetical protein